MGEKEKERGEREGRGRGLRVEGKVEGRECTYLELLFNRPTNSLKSM